MACEVQCFVVEKSLVTVSSPVPALTSESTLIPLRRPLCLVEFLVGKPCIGKTQVTDDALVDHGKDRTAISMSETHVQLLLHLSATWRG
jgi:hypothetical protein